MEKVVEGRSKPRWMTQGPRSEECASNLQGSVDVQDGRRIIVG